MWIRLLQTLKQSSFTQKLKNMAERIAEQSSQTLKRPAASIEAEVPVKVNKKGKKKKQHVVQLGKSEGFKRKIALLASYNGSGYYGVQVNGDYPTIEKDLFSALITAGAIPQDHAATPSKMWFQRGSRTDKGVSAVGQTFSLKVVLVPDFVNKINEHLPEKIRIMGYIRTTNGFDSKNFCCGRTYTYMSPTFAFAPIEKFITDDFRVEASTIERVREILKRFIGTHNFHNFTSGVKPDQASAKRYITGFECSDPYIREGVEFVTITVKGQSFMLHQIRKMIGLSIAVVRGYCGEDTIDKSWGPAKVDIPKAPGLGLVLEELHFDGYNKKFGCDGIHEPLDWSPYREEMAKFKEKYILTEIVSQEKADRVMFNWMRTLQYHNFAEPPPDDRPEKPWAYALRTILAKDAASAKDSSPSEGQEQAKLLPDNLAKDIGLPSITDQKKTNSTSHTPPFETESSSGPTESKMNTCQDSPLAPQEISNKSDCVPSVGKEDVSSLDESELSDPIKRVISTVSVGRSQQEKPSVTAQSNKDDTEESSLQNEDTFIPCPVTKRDVL